MKQDIRSSPWLKALGIIAAVACGTWAVDVYARLFLRGTWSDLPVVVGLTAAVLALTALLMSCAARRPEQEEFVLNWMDKIPYELYLFVVGCGVVAAFSFGTSALEQAYWYTGDNYSYVKAMWFLGLVLLAAGFLLSEATLMSTAARCKTRTLLRNTLTWRLCVWLWRGCKALGRGVGEAVGHLPLTWRVLLGALGYLLVNAILAWGLFQSYNAGFYLILLFLFNGTVLLLICRWTVQWQKPRAGAQAIVGGEPDAAIDLTGMRGYPDLRGHAEALNDLGGAINAAVEERLKSERFKAELITNVSHDLKTPLTSIINYVDLLKKEQIDNPKALEYIEVLDRKSQRLKKLTEDLVEASKASTGTLAVSPERLGMVQLADQALGEYGEKLEAAGLKLVATLPPEEVYVLADGRHVWRILDNLLGNCVKYAHPGTRVYLELAKWNGSAILSLKNISASQLNVPPEELMERFVRGDESRTTEGSGLGLSIARSLTELQGGAFRLDIDGDLFKATVALPLCPPPRQEE